MALLLINYELHKGDKKKYDEILKIFRLYDYIELGGSEYIINTDRKPSVVYDQINDVIDLEGDLFVLSLKKPCLVNAKKSISKWIEERLT